MDSYTWVPAALVVLFLPGLAWEAWLARSGQDPGERLAGILGVSLALPPVIALLGWMVGLRFSGPLVVGLYGLCALLALAGGLCRMAHRLLGGSSLVTGQLNGISTGLDRSPGPISPGTNAGFVPRLGRLRPVGGWLLVAVLGLGLVAWRLDQASTLAFPAWVDSVHHTLIVRLFLQNQGLPSDFSPFTQAPFYYHYGFHSLTALFAFWSGLVPDQAVLIFGQLLNAAVCLSVYRLGKALWGDVRRGLIAALLVGLVSQMPAYYLTWGRYTLLTGMVLLPLALAEALDFIFPRRLEVGLPKVGLPILGQGRKAARLALIALLVAGVLLSHFLAALILAVFLIILGFYRVITIIRAMRLQPGLFLPTLRGAGWAAKRGAVWPDWRSLLLLTGAVLVGLGLALPWVIRVLHYSLPTTSLDLVLPAVPSQGNIATYSPDYARYLWDLAGPYRSRWLLALAFPGLLLGLLAPRKAPPAFVFAVWSLVLVLGSMPIGLRLSPFRPDLLLIILFLPAGLFLGHFFVRVGEALNRLTHHSWPGRVAVCLALGLWVIWGVKETRSIINPGTIIADGADRKALEWVAANLPVQAHFYINSTPWQGNLYRGVDGGWWLEPFTGRETFFPTEAYAFGTSKDIQQVNNLAQQAELLNGCTDAFWKLVSDQHLTYIYLRQDRGNLQPDQLEGCAGIDLLYRVDGVYIYLLTK